MSRDHQECTEKLSDYLDGDLDEVEAAAVEAHLAGCGACREVLTGLRDLVAASAGLGDLEPAGDLWPGIASAIGGPGGRSGPTAGASVIELPSARSGSHYRGPDVASRRHTRIGRVAAAAALVAVSVGSTWWVAAARPGGAGAPAAASVPAGNVLRAAEAGTPSADLASELATLEEVLDAAQGALDPNTVRVLERNLDVIERAIADSREALALDPGNAFLTEHLERMYRRKLVYLQDAVRVAQWSS